jgi:hypothetical protein
LQPWATSVSACFVSGESWMISGDFKDLNFIGFLHFNSLA